MPTLSPSEVESRASLLLKRFYGYDTFRPKQLEIITHAIGGNDSLVLMPTGGGKSLCFQIPALMSEGLTIVVSPLIALMRDQVEALLANGIPAAAINSNQSELENRKVADMAFEGKIKLLYVSPETLLIELERWGTNRNISLIAIDEAHCISQWGHDFRPEYTQLGILKQRFPSTPIMALTATADRSTREDIVKQLNLRDPKIFISSFDRPNISLTVVGGAQKREKIATIARLTKKYEGDSGIVYCLSRKATEKMASDLAAKGIDAEAYHAGMSASQRNSVQSRFINGDLQIVCATVAFGMGIDKSNIRWVVHNNMPQSLENYYQEIGRAGRDGLPSEAILFYSVADLIMLERFIEESGQIELNTNKLRRMRDYAEASVCRRRILLSYFNEATTCDCGNCDICQNPPKRVDATIEAQMALSAIARTNGNAGISTLIDILRGLRRTDIVEKGYSQLKTFGVGRHVSAREWNNYFTQMLQLGMFDIHYSAGGKFEITDYGRSVLFNNQKVMMSPLATVANTPNQRKEKKRTTEQPSDALLNALKQCRTSIAKSSGVPAYVVFSDKTLTEIAEHRPTSKEAFSTIYGVGENKTNRYWRPFVDVVRKFEGLPQLPDQQSEINAFISLLNEHQSPAAVAKVLKTDLLTVNREIAELINADLFNDFRLVISREEFKSIMELNRSNNESTFRQLARTQFAPGLDEVAMAMASYMLRHR